MKKILCLILSIIMFMISTIMCSADNGDTYICEEYQGYVYEIAGMYNLCPELIMAMIEAESSGRADVVSKAGCIGLMQIYPKYHRERMKKLGVTDLKDAYGNILVGCDYVAELAEKYHDINIVLVGYNAGEYSKSMKRAKEGKWSNYAKKVVQRSEELERIHESDEI